MSAERTEPSDCKICNYCKHFDEAASEFGGIGNCLAIQNKKQFTSKYSGPCKDFDKLQITLKD